MAPTSNDEARREFWARSLEEALPFLEAVYAYPVEETGEPLVPLREAVAEAGVEMTFSERTHVLGLPRLFLLREGLVEPLLGAAREMNRRGWVLHVEDAYRTEEMQRHLARAEFTLGVLAERLLWECGGQRPSGELIVRRLAALIAPAPKVGTHMSGSAVDISVFDRESGKEVDRGGPYITLSEITPMDSPFLSGQARRNREEITALMARHGFVAYSWEFWHYSSGDAYAEQLAGSGRAARYGAVHCAPEGGAVTPIEDPCRLLNSPEELAEAIESYWR